MTYKRLAHREETSIAAATAAGLLPQDFRWACIFGSWLIAAVSALGALFFSEVMDVPPCILCWYQRIFMFPLVLMLPFALFPLDRGVVRYALPLALAGWVVALYHVLLVAGYIPESIRPCSQGVPCTDLKVNWFGFVSIPLLSLLAFSTIIALLAWTHIKAPK